MKAEATTTCGLIPRVRPSHQCDERSSKEKTGTVGGRAIHTTLVFPLKTLEVTVEVRQLLQRTLDPLPHVGLLCHS